MRIGMRDPEEDPTPFPSLRTGLGKGTSSSSGRAEVPGPAPTPSSPRRDLQDGFGVRSLYRVGPEEGGG